MMSSTAVWPAMAAAFEAADGPARAPPARRPRGRRGGGGRRARQAVGGAARGPGDAGESWESKVELRVEDAVEPLRRAPPAARPPRRLRDRRSRRRARRRGAPRRGRAALPAGRRGGAGAASSSASGPGSGSPPPATSRRAPSASAPRSTPTRAGASCSRASSPRSRPRRPPSARRSGSPRPEPPARTLAPPRSHASVEFLPNSERKSTLGTRGRRPASRQTGPETTSRLRTTWKITVRSRGRSSKSIRTAAARCRAPGGRRRPGSTSEAPMIEARWWACELVS